EKLVCVFSDTQLENAFVLPFYAQFRRFLEPIWSQMGLQPEQVVRCLFAKMPGETLIPTHHDNGPWVSKTHRVHVPIVTFADVEFKSGALEQSMQRYAFNEGTIVELNNAAKHSVFNGSKQQRIHLIFDYLEHDHAVTVKRSTLAAGCVCRQVRGRVEFVDEVDQEAKEKARLEVSRLSKEAEKQVTRQLDAQAAKRLAMACRHYFIEQIDALAFVEIVEGLVAPANTASFGDQLWETVTAMFTLLDERSHAELTRARVRAAAREAPVSAPNWCIIGAQKCGTTSLFQYLGQHAQVAIGRRREPHFFDCAWTAALQHELSEEDRTRFTPVLRTFAYSETPDQQSEDAFLLEGNSLDDLRIKYLLSLQLEAAVAEEVQKEPLDLVLTPPLQIGESTPSYLLYGEPVARRMRLVTPHMKLIVMLRDPVKRAFSHFHMTADESGTPVQLKRREAVKGKRFEQVVEDDLQLLEAAGVCGSEGMGHLQLDTLASRFQVYADALPQTHGAHSYLGRGLYAAQLALWLRVFPRDRILVIDLDDMRSPEGVQREAQRAAEHLGLREPLTLRDAERKNTRAYDPLDVDTEKRLRAFYAPFNEQLFTLLGQRFNWA
ncbi:hypothetical protein BBJ28_00025987, partial [Nothophytophthora sp. Chile5]